MDKIHYYLVSPRSNIAKLYFAWEDERVRIGRARVAYLKELQADEYYMDADEGIVRASFEEGVRPPSSLRPDKDNPGYYVPNLRKSSGKAILKKWQSFAWGAPSEAKKLLLHDSFVTGGPRGPVLKSATLWHNAHRILVATVPVKAGGTYNPPRGLYSMSTERFEKLRLGDNLNVENYIKIARSK